ncbi:hypothetical protein [Turkeypox virus]|uniref:Protein OPG091 n=1 Tax=Turkeypox virus TaxID=336486 RepID=A0A0M3ZHJ1_9POXV|nr:hypothetical protein ASN15_gp087 [Turkeypox virus]ALA62461.1 hypothetical protein [Turkeypox virus]
MDISLFDGVAPGALVLSTSNNSIINFFNPSEEKHSSLYIGPGIIDLIIENYIDFPTHIFDNYTKYMIEVNTSGMEIIPLNTFISNKKYIKVYYFMEGIFPDYKVMKEALIQSFTNSRKEYGLSKNKTYCFKMIADCYRDIGIMVKSYKILGRHLYLSQSFSSDNRWFKIIDTISGENLLTRNCYYFKRRGNSKSSTS